MVYDVMIIGGGPAGVAAGVYSARKRLKTLFLTYEFGGQSTVSPSVENWIGTINITGGDLGKMLRGHLEKYRGEFLTIEDRVKVKNVTKEEDTFKALTEDGKVFESKTVLISTGSRRKKLTVPGAEKYEGRGIVYCASCDAPLFEGMPVAVIGAGNAGFETANQLASYATSVTLLNKNAGYRADQITVEKTLQNPKIRAISNAEITEVVGDDFVTAIKYKNTETGEIVSLPVKGIFVEIGNIPESNAVKDLVALTPTGAIIADPRTQRTSVEGIWAAGDCTDTLYHQNNIAAGEGVVALEDIYNYLMRK